MILLFHFQLLKGFKNVINTNIKKKILLKTIRNNFSRIKPYKPNKNFKKNKESYRYILLKTFLPGLLLVKCDGNPKLRVKQNKFHPISFVKQEESLDWIKLFNFLSPDIWKLFLAVVTAVAVAFINVRLPLYLGNIIDVLTEISINTVNSSLSHLKEPVIKLFSMYILQALFTFVYVDLLSTVGENLACNLKNQLYCSIMQQELEFFDVNRTGEIIDRLTTDVQEFKSAFKLCVSQGLKTSTQIFGCLVSLMAISTEMSAVIIVIIPTVVLIGSLIGSKLRKISRNAQEQAAWSTIVSEETIANIRTVRAFAMEQRECEKFANEINKTGHSFKQLGFGIALFQAGTNIFLNCIVLLTLCMGGYMLSLKKISTGEVMSFLVAMQTIEKSLSQMSLLFGHFIKGMSSGTRIFQYMNLESKIPFTVNIKNIVPLTSFNADIEFKEVTFSYPTRPEQIILKDFNLKIPAGKVAAIVGSSGNGKSTVASLLLKFYRVTNGTVKIGGKDINELDENWLRGKVIGFINQEPVLFATSIKENIRYGNPYATDEEVYEAAKLANADEFIKQFPAGYETMVGEKGAAVSGGQKQRIAIARAFLKKPMILVLDEATSALDTISELQVQKSLESIMKDRTVVIIAHRLSTVKNADVIIVLDNGTIIEVGEHDELIKKKGYYWNLMNRQEKDKASEQAKRSSFI